MDDNTLTELLREFDLAQAAVERTTDDAINHSASLLARRSIVKDIRAVIDVLEEADLDGIQ